MPAFKGYSFPAGADEKRFPPDPVLPHDAKPLPVIWSRLLEAFWTFYHVVHTELRVGPGDKPIDIIRFTKVGFDEFRVSEYDPYEKVAPYHANGRAKQADELLFWKKAIKPTGKTTRNSRTKPNGLSTRNRS